MVIAWWMWRLQIKSDRALQILQDLTGLERGAAGHLLERSNRRVKLALMHWTGLEPEGQGTFGRTPR